MARNLVKMPAKPKVSFVIETFDPNNPENANQSEAYCARNSNEMTEKLVVDCRGAMTIKFRLTKEEGKQLRKSRNERRGKFTSIINDRVRLNDQNGLIVFCFCTGKGPFKVVFAGGKLKAQAVGLDNFTLANYESDRLTVFVLANVDSSSARIMVADSELRREAAFVIEGLPSWIDCKLINFSFLRPFSCRGNVVLRRFEYFDADL